MNTKPIPISSAHFIADAFGYDQVVIVARKVGGPEHVTTYGVDEAHCDVAARIGNFFKHKLMGWPAQPAGGRQRVEFDVRYYSNKPGVGRQLSHQYREAWEPMPLFCPKCGLLHVWRCAGEGDYYVGAQHICTACESTFYLPELRPAKTDGLMDEQNAQRLEALKP